MRWRLLQKAVRGETLFIFCNTSKEAVTLELSELAGLENGIENGLYTGEETGSYENGILTIPPCGIIIMK